MLLWSIFLFFLFKQKTAYEMRISDWSSDVCSSDLALRGVLFIGHAQHGRGPVAERAAPALAAQVQRGTARGKERQSQRHRNAVGKTVVQQLLELRRRQAGELAQGHLGLVPARQAQQVRRRRVHRIRSEEHTSELQSLMRISYAVFCLKKKNNKN